MQNQKLRRLVRFDPIHYKLGPNETKFSRINSNFSRLKLFVMHIVGSPDCFVGILCQIPVKASESITFPECPGIVACFLN